MDDAKANRQALTTSTAVSPAIRWYFAVLLSDRPRSAAELAQVAEMTPSAVRHHLRAMREEETIEVTERRLRRGMAEQVYRVRKEIVLTEDLRAQLSLADRRRIDAYTLKIAVGEAVRSLVSRPTRRSLERVDACLARVPMQVDERGWTELAGLHTDFFRQVLELRDQISGRVRPDHPEAFPVTSLLLLFEASPGQ